MLKALSVLEGTLGPGTRYRTAILVLLMHIVQSMEERIITRCGHYCLDNLVNRLYKAEP